MWPSTASNYMIVSKTSYMTGHNTTHSGCQLVVTGASRSLVHHELAARNSGLIIALMARSRSFSRSAIRAAQLSAGSAGISASPIEGGQTSSNALATSRENTATSFCSSRPAILCEGVNRSRCCTSAAVSSNGTEPRYLISTLSALPFGEKRIKFGHAPCAVMSLPASFTRDLSKYSSSSTVPLRPEPTFRSILRFERELRFVMRDTADVVGALVYRVKAVKAEASVITSTFCTTRSSTP